MPITMILMGAVVNVEVIWSEANPYPTEMFSYFLFYSAILCIFGH